MKWTRRNFLLAITTLPAVVSLCGSDTTKQPSQMELKSSLVNLQRLLRCIAEVETGNDDTKVGKNGERSRYQISITVWSQHIDPVSDIFWYRNFERECNGDIAKQVALRHVQWLDKTIPRISITEVHFRPYALAWAWHGGLESWTHQDDLARFQHSTRVRLNNYATRVTNLYDDAKFGTE